MINVHSYFWRTHNKKKSTSFIPLVCCFSRAWNPPGPSVAVHAEGSFEGHTHILPPRNQWDGLEPRLYFLVASPTSLGYRELTCSYIWILVIFLEEEGLVVRVWGSINIFSTSDKYHEPILTSWWFSVRLHLSGSCGSAWPYMVLDDPVSKKPPVRCAEIRPLAFSCFVCLFL